MLPELRGPPIFNHNSYGFLQDFPQNPMNLSRFCSPSLQHPFSIPAAPRKWRTPGTPVWYPAVSCQLSAVPSWGQWPVRPESPLCGDGHAKPQPFECGEHRNSLHNGTTGLESTFHRVSMICRSFEVIFCPETRTREGFHGCFVKSSARLTLGMVSNVLWIGVGLGSCFQIIHATVLFHSTSVGKHAVESGRVHAHSSFEWLDTFSSPELSVFARRQRAKDVREFFIWYSAFSFSEEMTPNKDLFGCHQG